MLACVWVDSIWWHSMCVCVCVKVQARSDCLWWGGVHVRPAGYHRLADEIWTGAVQEQQLQQNTLTHTFTNSECHIWRGGKAESDNDKERHRNFFLTSYYIQSWTVFVESFSNCGDRTVKTYTKWKLDRNRPSWSICLDTFDDINTAVYYVREEP